MRTMLVGVLACSVAGCVMHDATIGGDGDDSSATSVDAGVGSGSTVTPSGSRDISGYGDTVVAGGGAVDTTNAFFSALGTNDRSCGSCHDQTTGWTVTPAALTARFTATAGTDPIFRLVDGATSPTADVSTLAAMQTAYAMLLTKGLIRIGLPIPANAEFTLDAVDDPYGFASAAELSLFRRPLPTTNLRFLSSTMWDGREASLTTQATSATLGHEQAATADADTMAAIVGFEGGLYTAQSTDAVAGTLPGPTALVTQAFAIGINDSLAADGPDAAQGTPFDRNVFDLYATWANATGNNAEAQRQQSITRGEAIFNTHPIQIVGVDGIPAGTMGACSTCHDTPNVGDHSVALLLDLGLAATVRRTPDLPLYTLRNTATGATVQTTDPGRALVTGAWSDISKFKVPVLRGLAMRAPYFHNGSAPNLAAVVQFYDTRFRIGLNPQDQQDLVAFLSAL